MSRQELVADKFWPLLNAVCDNTLIETQIQELEAVLNSDVTTRELFLDHLQLQTRIRFLGRAERARNIGLARVHAMLPQASKTSFPSPAATFLSSTLHGTLGCFPEGMPLAYLIATVVTGLGILIASHVYMSGPEQIAHTSPPATVVVEPAPVGRITGMVECKWEKEGSGFRVQGSEAATHRSLVALSDKFALASGLMEITYDTGAKVILQGPVTYQVESNGGYLAVGKLTGKLEKKAEGGRRKAEEAANHKSEIINQKSPFPVPPSPFVIRTPTATITDLGTEFGVEVAKDGSTKSHVFHGAVSLQLAGAVKGGTHAVVVRENESARVEGGDGAGAPTIVVHRTAVDPDAFVRRMICLPKVLDLLDIVAGGNGTGKRRNRGISPISGLSESSFIPDICYGQRRYTYIGWHKFIDGVFIPAGVPGRYRLIRTDTLSTGSRMLWCQALARSGLGPRTLRRTST